MSARRQTHPSYGSTPSSRPPAEALLRGQLETLRKFLECLEKVQNMHCQAHDITTLRNLEKKMSELHTAVKKITLEIQRSVLELRNSSDPNKQSQADQLERQLFQAEKKYQQDNEHHRKMILRQLPAPETDRVQGTDADAIEFRTYADLHEADEQFIRDRAEGMEQLEQDMLQLNQMFSDIGTMIHQQGFVLDNIESNMTAADTYTGHAVEELQNAKEYQNKSRKKLFCICFWLLLVLAVIILSAVTTAKH